MKDPDVEASTDEEIFREAVARQRIADEAEGRNRVLGIEWLKFEDGAQWPDDVSNDRKINGRPALTINHTRTFVRRVVNNIKQQRPRIKCHPVGDGADIESAKVINGLIRHIETNSRASVAYDTAAESAVKIGWGYWRVTSDYIDEKSFDQELFIKPIRNVFTVSIDPSALLPDASDMQWCLISEKVKRIDFKREHPREELADWQGTGAGDEFGDWENKEEIRLCEYFRVSQKAEWLYKMVDGSTMYESDLPSPETMDAARFHFAMEDGKPVRRRSERRQIEWYRLNGSKIVDRRVLPGKWIPIVRCEGNVLDVNGEVRRSGMVKEMMDPARMFNYWRTAETEVVALAPKAPWIVAEGQIEGHPEWHSANTKPYSALVYKPVVVEGVGMVPPPIRQAPAQIPAAQANAAQSAEHDLMAVAGMPHEPQQDKPGEVVSGVALRRRQALSDISHFQYYDNQTLAIAHTGNILLEYIRYYYAEPRMQRIIGEDGVPETVALNQQQPQAPGAQAPSPEAIAIKRIKNDVTVGRYSIVMDTGPGYQTKREEGAEAMLDLMRTELGEPIVKVGADIVVRNMDFAGADDLADRLATTTPQGLEKMVEGLPKQAQTIVATLQKQLQAQAQEMQHLQLELKYKTSTELGWMHVEREKNKLSAETKVHDTELRAHTARDVAEIQAAGTLLNTHAEADHEKEAAKLLLKSAEKVETEH